MGLRQRLGHSRTRPPLGGALRLRRGSPLLQSRSIGLPPSGAAPSPAPRPLTSAASSFFSAHSRRRSATSPKRATRSGRATMSWPPRREHARHLRDELSTVFRRGQRMDRDGVRERAFAQRRGEAVEHTVLCDHVRHRCRLRARELDCGGRLVETRKMRAPDRRIASPRSGQPVRHPRWTALGSPSVFDDQSRSASSPKSAR